jgi:ABC-2 type transport system permease protein
MNRALWEKAMREGRWLLLGSCVVLFAFHFLRVWVTSHFNTGFLQRVLQHAPPLVNDLLPVPQHVVASTAGRVAMPYEEPLCVVLVTIWAVARGSDVVAGELNRGTMEMLLGQPVRRVSVLISHSVVTVAGLVLLCLCSWLGTWAGTSWIKLEVPVDARIMLPAAVNLFALGFFLAGLTTCISSLDRYRSRTIGIVVAFYVVETILKIVGRAASDSFAWMNKFTFLTYFEPQLLAYRFWPQVMARDPSGSWEIVLVYNGVLLVLGLVGYFAAAIIFCRRDLPAPL